MKHFNVLLFCLILNKEVPGQNVKHLKVLDTSYSKLLIGAFYGEAFQTYYKIDSNMFCRTGKSPEWSHGNYIYDSGRVIVTGKKSMTMILTKDIITFNLIKYGPGLFLITNKTNFIADLNNIKQDLKKKYPKQKKELLRTTITSLLFRWPHKEISPFK